MLDSRGNQVVKLEVIEPQKRAEELVRWHAKSSLIECLKGHHVSFYKRGERRVLWHPTRIELRRYHKPMLHEFLQVARQNGGRGSILLSHGSRRKGGHHFRDPGIASYLFSLLSFFCPSFIFLGTGKEVRIEWLIGQKDIRVRNGDCHLLIPWHWWSSGWALSDVVRGLVN
jgi:hypothetical protein